MQVGIIGLGLIGGSAARAYKEAGYTVLSHDKDKVMLDYAMLCGAVDGVLSPADLGNCDLVLICLYPRAAITYLTENAAFFAKGNLVIDFCGTKKGICEVGFALAKEHGFLFVGGHPMAGTHNSGFKYSRSDMFSGAPMVIVPPVYDDMALLDRIKKALSPLSFGSISVTNAEKHDKMIAFTSQLPHVLACSYISDPLALSHKGFSAGSFLDVTRVAFINDVMWSELFIDNADHLCDEIDELIKNLSVFKAAIKNEDKQALSQMMIKSRELKEKT